MNTIENNKIIAEFMGGNIVKPQNFIYLEHTKKYGHKEEELKYHSSWNWLMKVVEKIRFIDQTAKGDFKTNLLHYQRNNKTTFDLSILEGKEYVYNACVEFIKWYNDQKN